MKKEPKPIRTAIISDIHLGSHCADETWHKLAVGYATWLSYELKARNITQLFILGDVFNDRKEISGRTISAATDFFNALSDFEIFVLVGNHDCFYDKGTDVNSISMLGKWANMTVITEMTKYNLGGRNILICPWGSDPMSLGERFDAVFGHFEINSFNMTQMQVCEGRMESSDIRKVSPMVFSGHFHLRDERKYGTDRIYYVGSPYQLNWGDYGTTKAVYLYDIATGEVDSFLNSYSPVHVKVDAAKLGSGGVSAANNITGNIVRIVSSAEVEAGIIEKTLRDVQQLKPLELTCDIKRTPLAVMALTTADSSEVGSAVTVEDGFRAYVDKLDTSVDKVELHSELLSIYKETKRG